MVRYRIINLFPAEFRTLFEMAARRQEWLQEIRLRVYKPICVMEKGQEFFLNEQGRYVKDAALARSLSAEEIAGIMNHICQYSLYAYEDELRQGFLSVTGGHRIGIVGQAVLSGAEEIRTIRHISGLNIRIAHEIKGAADRVLPHIYQKGRLRNTLIISPPGCGKTTMLRDMIRQVSDGNPYGEGRTVGVVDERSEIAGCFRGCPQNDVGIRTDVLDSCPKVKGMMLLIRSMSPNVIAIDELGEPKEWEMLKYASCCGTSILATMHGEGMEDLKNRSGLYGSQPQAIFEMCIILGKRNGKCVIEKIYEAKGDWRCIWQNG